MKGRTETRWLLCLAAGALLLGGGCGGGSDSASGDDDAAQGGIRPCELLSSEQVSTVLEKHDEGYEAHAGGSLIKGVDAYQCSYSDPDTNIFTVVLNVAADDERFEAIKPSGTFRHDETKLDVGDYGWLMGDPDDAKVEVVKGRTVIDLELMAPGAMKKKDALIALAGALAAKAD